MDEILSLPQTFSLNIDDIRRGNSDSERVVTELYIKLRQALVSYVYHLTGSSRDAEDVVQIAFLQLFDCLNENAEIHNVRGWLYRVVHNLAIDDVRQAGRRQRIFNKWLPDYETQAVEETAEDILIRRELIDKSLAMLNEREQRCLMLRAEGLSYQEIADVLETSSKSVSVYLARGLKKFESRNED
jgi:RNA polymerase sigma-70 factor (ECF subfamily)